MRNLIPTTAFLIATGSALAAQDCSTVLADYAFCPEEDWQSMDVETPEGIFLWQKEGVTGKLIVERHRAGTAPETEMVMDAIKDSVRMSLADPDMAMFQQQMTYDGKAQRIGSMVYELDFFDDVIRVHHSVMVTETFLMQYTTITEDDDPETGADAHREFVSSFQTKTPDFAT